MGFGYLQERDVREESGWKLVHGDVFRSPRNLVLLSALVGTGAQLAMLILLVILLAIVGMLYVGRGAIVTTFIVCYALTAFISGYVSGGFYSRNEGKKLYTPSGYLCSSYHIHFFDGN
jgi:transmembrane 9 superfamily protein 3